VPVISIRFVLVVLACLAAAAAPAAIALPPHETRPAQKKDSAQPEHAIGQAQVVMTPPVRLRPSELDCADVPLRRINEAAVRATFAKVKKPIQLSVHETTPVVSFGAGRNTEADYVVLQASREIPEGILSKNFEIDTREPMKRIGASSLESVHLRAPRYTRPHFFNHRREIGFNLCVVGAGADPGTYTGQFVFVGPGKIASVVLTQTAQLKATHSTFWWFAGFVLAAMLVVLGFKAVLEHRGELNSPSFFLSCFRVLFFVAAGGVAMWLAYSEAPTWGENLAFAISALIATAFTAAGLGNTLTAAAGNFRDETKKKRSEGR
jgi:hypothetical protein